MLTIAFDQSTTTTGWSVFKNRDLVAYGKINHDGDITDRTISMVEDIVKVIDSFHNKYKNEKLNIVLEDIQLQRSPLTFKQLAHLQGALIFYINHTYKINPEIYSAAKWKSWNHIGGKARAEQKKNAQKKIRELYMVKVTQDEADAILLGKYAAESVITWI